MLASLNATTQRPSPLRIAFAGGPPQPDVLVRLELPWLAGCLTEELFQSVIPLSVEGEMRLYREGGWVLGHSRVPLDAQETSSITQSVYRHILAATHGLHLYRIWNYVPHINENAGGLENYRAFCQGRSLAFETTLGGEFHPRLPAASAVGCQGAHLDVIFAAGEAAPAHFENPEQVPAYHYPIEHGPRPPSFARSTVVRDGRRTWIFISGTSAIKGHQTVAPGALEAQLACTVDNLRLIASQSGAGENLGAGRIRERHFKVYLRHATDLAAARTRLEQSFFDSRDVVTYLQADICRAELNIEIEATLME